jgi:hypothetical protein
MKKYAVLDSNGSVVNIIIAASLSIAEQVTSSYCILIPLGMTVDIGDVYSDEVFSKPPLTIEQQAEADALIAAANAPDSL